MSSEGGWKSYSVALPPDRVRPELKCSFCGKAQHEVGRLAAAGRTDIAICDECVRLCVEIFEE